MKKAHSMHIETIFAPSDASVMAIITENTIPPMIAKNCKEQMQGGMLLYRFALWALGI